MRAALLAVALYAPLAGAARADARAPAAGDRGAARLEPFAAAGAAWATHDDLRALGLDAGPAVEVGVAFRVASHLAVRAGAGYLAFAHRDSFLRRAGGDPGAPVEQLDVERRLRVLPLLASVRGSAGFGRFEASALVGAGVAVGWHDVTSRSSVTGTSSWSSSDAAPALAIGAGVSTTLSTHVALGVEARYLLAAATFSGRPTSTATAVDVAARIDTLALTATVAWRP